MKALVAMAVVAGFWQAAEAPRTEKDAKDLEKMQGDWAAVSYVRDGQKIPSDDAQALFRTVKGNDYIISRYDQEIGRGTFTFDASKKPKTIDAVASTGPTKGKPMLGIYEIDASTLKLVFALPGAARPKEFDSKEGSGHAYSVWERERKR